MGSLVCRDRGGSLKVAILHSYSWLGEKVGIRGGRRRFWHSQKDARSPFYMITWDICFWYLTPDRSHLSGVKSSCLGRSGAFSAGCCRENTRRYHCDYTVGMSTETREMYRTHLNGISVASIGRYSRDHGVSATRLIQQTSRFPTITI